MGNQLATNACLLDKFNNSYMSQVCRTPPTPGDANAPPPRPVGVGGGMFPSPPPLWIGLWESTWDKRDTPGHVSRLGLPEDCTTTQFMHTIVFIVKHKCSEHWLPNAWSIQLLILSMILTLMHIPLRILILVLKLTLMSRSRPGRPNAPIPRQGVYHGGGGGVHEP